MRSLLPVLAVALLVFGPFVGLRLDEHGGVTFHWVEAGLCIAFAVIIRFGVSLIKRMPSLPRRREFRFISLDFRLRGNDRIGMVLGFAATILPLLPFAGREGVDLATLILTYATLAAALNIVVGYAGLLDLGFIAFFAIGAYTYGILSTRAGIGFWTCLPLTAVVPAAMSGIIGIAVLRLRGDYFAIVTLGFLQIVDTLLVNWSGLTSGSQGISGIPRPTLFGLASFGAEPQAGVRTFADMFGVPFTPMQRVVFLYYLTLALTIGVNLLSSRLRTLPLGRAWEAVREDEIAAASVGIRRAPVKLAAYAISAAIAGVTGGLFAARQGFISPESFTFMDSAIVLAIVVLGGAGNRIGIVVAALVVIGAPELFRQFADYRMLVFGGAMVAIMLLRPNGLAATRAPGLRLGAP